jgi:hypothetical protein
MLNWHKIYRSFLSIFFYFFIFHILFARPIYGQNNLTNPIKYPWAGGMNDCQFLPIDFDLDGKKDMLIFDRAGNRLLPFLNSGESGQTAFTYHPEFASSFPELHDWVILKDYDCDNKEDIFTYGLGGIRIFKNISDSSLKFKLITNQLRSYYYSGKIGILVTPVDYPAISDIDGDGDLDLLTFFGLGSYVEFHRNLSIEKYGTCDSLDFKLEDKCWGNFKESEGSNSILLNVPCPYKKGSFVSSSCNDYFQKQRHTGSTLVLSDLNGDGTKDLLLGDIDYPGIIALFNGGTPDSSNMVSQDTLFPSSDIPVSLCSFPAAFFMDIDNDSINDLLLSPFDPNLTVSDNFQSCWLYKNKGTNDHPDFHFMTNRFIQSEMIDIGSNSFPILTDINGDGLPDLIIGNYGYYDTTYYQEGILTSVYISQLTLFFNTGTLNHPAFTLVSKDFGALSAEKLTALVPTMGDLDGDGDQDLITGNADGTLLFFENTAGPGTIPVFTPPEKKFQKIDVGSFSTPVLYDIDKDGLLDLIIGEQNGNLNFYKNTGSSHIPVFTYITDSLGKINTTNPALSYYGYSSPSLFKDAKNKINLLVGSEEGKIHYYPDISNLSGKFTESDSLLSIISINPITINNPGWRTTCVMAYLTDPNYADLIIGNFSGGLNYYSNGSQPEVITATEIPQGQHKHQVLSIYPNPADDVIHVKFSTDHLSGRMTLELLSQYGTIIKEYRAPSTNNEITLPCTEIPNGLYLLKLGQSIGKVIIIHSY